MRFVFVFLLSCAHPHGYTLAPARYSIQNPFATGLLPGDPCSDVNLAMADEAVTDTIKAAISGDDSRWQLEVKNLEGRGRLGKCMASRAIVRVKGHPVGEPRVQGWIDSHP